jgi:hypothetical protein
MTAASIEELRGAGQNIRSGSWTATAGSGYRHPPHPRAGSDRADQDNPYDIAQAVTDYLRNNISYSETVPLVLAG